MKRMHFCFLAATFAIGLVTAPLDPRVVSAESSASGEAKALDRGSCEQSCIDKCPSVPMKKFLCEKRCRNQCKKDFPSVTDKKRGR